MRHGIDAPWILSRWLDAKSSWSADEVATRLGITHSEAE
jgi:hypothetical protein